MYRGDEKLLRKWIVGFWAAIALMFYGMSMYKYFYGCYVVEAIYFLLMAIFDLMMMLVAQND